MRLFTIILSGFLLTSSCTKEPATQSGDPELAELFSLMQGSFNSLSQSVSNPDYFNISLHMYPIWFDRGNWLYVEQAMFDRQEAPYRQRIYEVRRDSLGQLESVIYTIPNEADFVQKWNQPQAFESLTPDMLEKREGCSVFLNRVQDNYFTGSTIEGACPSDLRGATYATSVVAIYEGRMVSWDRGFDSAGNQVWGATAGGYIFERY